MENKITLIGMTLEELQGVAQRGKMPRFVGKQLAEWITGKGTYNKPTSAI